jgi:hypothetical protein
MTPEIIRSIREDQECYDRDPEAYERRERDMQEEREREQMRLREEEEFHAEEERDHYEHLKDREDDLSELPF